jgi:CubicO group peptidase (beta-lactamase class C family)
VIEYSDIGFILLGEALSKLADENLDTFFQREVCGPLGLSRTGFNPPAEKHPLIPPTLDDHTFRNRVLQGEVNDDNASAMGGVAGHAGLFAPAEDVASFAHAMLGARPDIFRDESLAIFTRRDTQPPETSRTLGWDTPNQNSLAGRHFLPGSFGHLGFTGTSLWIDRQREISITLLTNRTWPDGTNIGIRQVRPAFHDAIMEGLIDQ